MWIVLGVCRGGKQRGKKNNEKIKEGLCGLCVGTQMRRKRRGGEKKNKKIKEGLCGLCVGHQMRRKRREEEEEYKDARGILWTVDRVSPQHLSLFRSFARLYECTQ